MAEDAPQPLLPHYHAVTLTCPVSTLRSLSLVLKLGLRDIQARGLGGVGWAAGLENGPGSRSGPRAGRLKRCG